MCTRRNSNRVVRCRALTVALCLIVGTAACAVDASSPSVRPDNVPQISAGSTSQATASSVAPVVTTGTPPIAAGTSTTTAGETLRSTVPYPTTTIDIHGLAYVGPLTFKWPSACTVKVISTTNTTGIEFVHEFDLTLADEGRNLVVSYGRPTIVAVDGHTTAIVPTKGTIGGPIDFAVTPAGEFSGIVHADEWLAPFPDRAKNGTRLVANATSAVQTAYWLVPIGAWQQFDGVARPEPRTDSLTLPGNGIYDRRMETLPVGPPGRARLRIQLSRVVDTEPTPGPSPAQTADDSTGAMPSMVGRTIIITFEAVLDPVTMRPDVATVRTEFSPAVEGTDGFFKSDSYAFDWKNSNCR
jgi:hypothetical protein